MAFIETRKNKDGARRYRVWWRLGGTRYGEPQSETFFDKGSALTFKLAVEAAGHDWPDGYVKGVGWIGDEPEQLESADEPVLFSDYAFAYVRGLSGVDARTSHDYERDLTRHLLPVFGHLDIRDGRAFDRALVRSWVNRLQAGEPDPAGFQNPATWPDLGFYAARSYSVISPPRTGRRLTRSWVRSTAGRSERGDCNCRARCGRRPL